MGIRYTISRALPCYAAGPSSIYFMTETDNRTVNRTDCDGVPNVHDADNSWSCVEKE